MKSEERQKEEQSYSIRLKLDTAKFLLVNPRAGSGCNDITNGMTGKLFA
jgi:hypothetical protein